MKISFDSFIRLCILGAAFFVPLAFSPLSAERFELPKFSLVFLFSCAGFFAWVFNMVMHKKEIRIQNNILNIPVLLLLLAAGISSALSKDVWASLLGTYGRFSDGFFGTLAFALLYFLVVNTASPRDIGLYIKAFLFSSALATGIAFLSLLGALQWSGAFFNPVAQSAQEFAAWLAGILALCVGLYATRQVKTRLFFPALFVFAGMFVVLLSPWFFKVPISQESVIPQSVSWSIALQTIAENPKTLLLGSGPATFGIDFALHKEAGMQFRVDRAGNHSAELLSTLGVLGFLAWGAVALFFALGSFLIARKKPFALGIASMIAIFFFAQFFFYQNMVLLFTFWIFLAFGVVAWDVQRETRISLRKFFEVALASRILLLGVAVAAGVGIVEDARFYLADVAYAKQLDRAQELNPYRLEYAQSRASRALAIVSDQLKKPKDEQDKTLIANSAKDAVLFAAKAEALGPNRVATWEFLGKLYGTLSFANNASDWAIRSFARAQELEPANPSLYNELSKIYLEKSDFTRAQEQIDRVLRIDPNFAGALVQQGLLAEKEGNSQGAISAMEKAAQKDSSNPGILFQLGRLYLNANATSKAIAQFQLVIRFDPANSNAHFALGNAFEKQGEKKEALAEFQKVLELNPGNQEIINKINSFKIL